MAIIETVRHIIGQGGLAAGLTTNIKAESLIPITNIMFNCYK